MKRIHVVWLLLMLLIASLPATALADEVTDWNAHMLQAFITGNVSGLLPTRHAAIVQSAVYDAVNGIERRYEPIRVQPDAAPGASRRAAAVQAAYASLLRLFPAQQADLDAKRQASLAGIASQNAAENQHRNEEARRNRHHREHGSEPQEDSQSIARGIEWGQKVADEIWAWRSTDGFTPTPPANNGGMLPGQWRPTPPGFASFALVQFATMTPWAIPSPAQFPIPGPPALTSSQYRVDFNEVKLLGSLNSVARTQAQTDLARFWASANGPSYFWNRVATRLAAERHTTLSENARVLALLNLSIADAGISVWANKKNFLFWRPITAIQLADTDANPATIQDATWTPLITTPPYPDYPSGLCGMSAGGIGILSAFFGAYSDFYLDSNGQPGVVRVFGDFQLALSECVEARILGGIHFRTADFDGVVLGNAVARYVFYNALQPIYGRRTGQLEQEKEEPETGRDRKREVRAR